MFVCFIYLFIYLFNDICIFYKRFSFLKEKKTFVTEKDRSQATWQWRKFTIGLGFIFVRIYTCGLILSEYVVKSNWLIT